MAVGTSTPWARTVIETAAHASVIRRRDFMIMLLFSFDIVVV